MLIRMPFLDMHILVEVIFGSKAFYLRLLTIYALNLLTLRQV